MSASPQVEVDALSIKGPVSWDPKSRSMTLASGDLGAVLVDARVLRRVIKRHRKLPGLGLDVPHADGYAIDREALLEIVPATELGATGPLPDMVVLLPRPEAPGAPDGEVLRRLWRAAFHARVHLVYEAKLRAGALTPAAIRERIHRLGHCEYDEAQIVLKQERRLLARDDEEGWTELAATYLELRHFEPHLVARMFPVLVDLDAVDALVAEDVDVAALLDATRPAGARSTTEPAPPSSRGDAPESAEKRDGSLRAGLVESAEAARQKGNHVRAAIDSLAAASLDGVDAATAAADEAAGLADLEALASSLEKALGGDGAGGGRAAWTRAFATLARRAVRGTFVESGIEARALFDVQKACVDAARTPKTVELAAFIRSFGKKPIVRALPAAREVLVARRLRAAHEHSARAHLPKHARDEVHAVFHALRHEAIRRLRAALRPRIEETFAAVGLAPTCAVERVALGSVVAQLLDATEARGFFGIGQLRDALSKNRLKLPNVTPGQLVRGDALLRADRRLGDAIDGVYREGEIYLRGLQAVSSVAFGTRVGRFLTLYLAIPFGASFVALEGLGHLVSAVSELAGGHHVHLLNTVSFAALGVVLFALMHVPAAQRGAWTALRLVLGGLHAAFVTFPKWFFARSWTRAIFESRPFKILHRFVLRPAFAAGLVACAVHLVGSLLHARWTPIVAAVTAAVALVFFAFGLNSRAGVLAEELVVDWTLRRLSWLTRELVPGVFRLVASFFGRVLELVERTLYAVDEWLRFREGENPIALGAKVVFGFVWFFVAYVVRLYTNLLIEPQVNPIKHFPVVTVSHKIILPFAKKMGQGAVHGLTPYVGKAAALTIVPPTVLLLPGVFGFLVWELKENFRLYDQNRRAELSPVAIGHHGEDMARLLRPGLHSGTVPKLFTKLRKATLSGDARGVHAHEDELAEVREAIEKFVEREIVALVAESPAWKLGRLAVAHVELAPSRARVSLGLADGAHDDNLVVSFEEQSGLLCAGVSRPGFAARLDEAGRRVLENALAVLYRLTGAALSREAIADVLAGAAYDVSDEGLVVWPGPGYRTELVYKLDAPKVREPKVRGDAPTNAPASIDVGLLLLRLRPLSYKAFRDAWESETPARLESGPSLLPAENVPAQRA